MGRDSCAGPARGPATDIQVIAQAVAQQVDRQHNDEYGHAVGDEVLVWLAGRIQRMLRESDRAGRWGGEEFLILLPYTGMSGSTRFAERLLEEITAVPFKNDDVTIHLTVTIGVAKADLDRDKNPEGLINRADTAMYTGKEQGRNQVVVANWNGV